MHEVILGRPSALLELDIEHGDDPVVVLDVNNRVGGNTYWWFLRRATPARILTPHQSVALFQSFGVPTDDAWRMLDSNVDALKERLPECVKLMEQHGIFSPNFGWRFAKFPKTAVFLGAETLPDEFWWRLDRAGGRYWVVGDPFGLLHQRIGYSRLLTGRNLLRLPKTVKPLVDHIVTGAGEEDDGPIVYQGTLDEIAKYFEDEGHRLTVVTYTKKELAALPEYVERPLFQGMLDPVFLKTMMDRFYTGSNGLWMRIMKEIWNGVELGTLVAPALTDINLKELTPESRMADIYGDDPRIAELTVGEYTQKPWKHRYSAGAKCVARSVFALTSAHNIAYNPQGPWRGHEEQTYKTVLAASRTLTMLR